MSNTETIEIDVRTFSYVERPVFDIYSNQKIVGVAGGGEQITGVRFKLGAQTVTWRLGGPKGMVRNGETVTARNTPILGAPPPKARYLGIHIYPDESAEFAYSEFLPERTDRGEALLKQQAGGK